MKLLVIPDVHLKPWMFDNAEAMMQNLQEAHPDESWNFVCLGDIPDDFGKQADVKLYEETWNRAIQFAVDHPDALWCYGNHDVSYLLGRHESGYSFQCEFLCRNMMIRLILNTNGHMKYLHLVDNVLFSHGGLNSAFVSRHVKLKDERNIPFVVDCMNKLSEDDMWEDWSPMWFRPREFCRVKTYYPRKLLQVVGHTPVKKVHQIHGFLMCDTFSTYPNGDPYGTQEFVVVDTITKEWYTVPGISTK